MFKSLMPMSKSAGHERASDESWRSFCKFLHLVSN